jgi:hypothetical protein
MPFENFSNDVVLIAPGTVVTVTGTSTPVRLDNKASIRLQSVVTAVAGTSPTVTVTIQTSHDGSTGWATVGSAFTAQTAANDSGVKVVGLIDRYVRVSYVVGGSAGQSLTFGVYGEAV